MAEKARTPRSGAEREAKYASKMKILFSKNFARVKKMTNIRYVDEWIFLSWYKGFSKLQHGSCLTKLFYIDIKTLGPGVSMIMI